MDENKLVDMAVRIENIDARSKSNAHRIDGLESDMKEAMEMQLTLVKLANGIETIGNQLMSVKEDIQDVKTGQAELSDKVTVLENRPAVRVKERWDWASDQLLWLFLTGVAGFLLASVLPAIF